jgi:hypothetical protein
MAARRFSSGPRVVQYTGKNVNVTSHIGPDGKVMVSSEESSSIISKEETMVLRQLYEVKEEEGLD